MTSLADFKLEVVKAGQHIPPEPPKVTKSDIYDDIAVFSSVDEHAIEVVLLVKHIIIIIHAY